MLGGAASVQGYSTVVECFSAFARPEAPPSALKNKKPHKQTENQTSCAWADEHPLFSHYSNKNTFNYEEQTAQSWFLLGRQETRTVTFVPGTNEVKLQILGAFAAYKLPRPWNLPSQLQPASEHPGNCDSCFTLCFL